MRSIQLALAAIVAAAFAYAPGATFADPVKIRTSYVVPVANWASLLPAKADLMTHLNKTYTLDVTRFQGTPPMITALASHDLDIGDLAFSSFALAVQNAGLTDLRIISDDFQDGVPGYYTDQYFVMNDSPIKTVEDLKGKVLATNAGGSAVDIAMRAMLRKHHLNDKTDVTIVEAAFPNMRQMLAEHKVDLIPGVLPFSYNPDLLKMAHPLFSQKDAVGRTQMIVWAAHADWLKQNRAAVVDFMEDTIRVIRWFQNPKNHAAAVQIAVDTTKIPAPVWDSWLFVKGKDYYRSPSALPDLKALQANIETQRQLGFLDKDIDVSQYADLSIAKDAAARLKK
ncbi:MAG TPA: ABC transporter substrate-binding protein [Stellaceae bacterium]|nr:ABC transporter substrate-binding protein [Stellaceae bacterium]